MLLFDRSPDITDSPPTGRSFPRLSFFRSPCLVGLATAVARFASLTSAEEYRVTDDVAVATAGRADGVPDNDALTVTGAEVTLSSTCVAGDRIVKLATRDGQELRAEEPRASTASALTPLSRIRACGRRSATNAVVSADGDADFSRPRSTSALSLLLDLDRLADRRPSPAGNNSKQFSRSISASAGVTT